MNYFKHHTFEYTAWVHIRSQNLGYIVCNNLEAIVFSSVIFWCFSQMFFLWSLWNPWLSLRILVPLGLLKLKIGNSIVTNSAAARQKEFLKIQTLNILKFFTSCSFSFKVYQDITLIVCIYSFQLKFFKKKLEKRYNYEGFKIYNIVGEVILSFHLILLNQFHYKTCYAQNRAIHPHSWPSLNSSNQTILPFPMKISIDSSVITPFLSTHDFFKSY